MGAWSRLMPRPSSIIKALVFLVFGEVTPSWSSLTSGSADDGFLCPETGLGLEMGLEDICSDGIFSLGLEVEDDGLGVREEPLFPVGILEMGLGSSPEPRLDLEPFRCSEEDFILDEETEAGLGVEVALGLVIAGLGAGLLAVGLMELLLSLSLRWLL